MADAPPSAADPHASAAAAGAPVRGPGVRPGPARVAAPRRPWRGLETRQPGASLAERPFSATERATLAARAHHVAIGEDPGLVPWHDPALDARALAWASQLAARGDALALAEAARLVRWVHADVGSRDALAAADLATARGWWTAACVGGPRRATLRTGALLWNGRRVRLGWRDRVETVNALWVDVTRSRWQALQGRYEAAAAAAARLAGAGDVLLSTNGRGAAREAERWLAQAMAAEPASAVGGVTVRDVAALLADEDATIALLRRCASWILAAPLDDECRLDGTFDRWLEAFGRDASARATGHGDDARAPDELRLLVGADLRPDQARVQRELHAVATTLDAAECAWHAAGGATSHETTPGSDGTDGRATNRPADTETDAETAEETT